MTERMDINRLLGEMRQMRSQVQAFQQPNATNPVQDVAPWRRTEGVGEPQKMPAFGQLLENAIDHVNSTQKTASTMASAFERGEPGVDVTDVMIASQKASVSFQSLMQVRNKVIDAYRDVMNMSV